MTTFKIFQRSQSVQVLGSAGFDANEIAHIVNRAPHGWEARRVELVDNRYQPVGETVRVSHLINQVDGAARIAEALGL